jgi:hypothetical protein
VRLWERYPEECGLFFWYFHHAFVQELRSAALSALGHLKPEDKVALFAFSECAERLSEFTNNTVTGYAPRTYRSARFRCFRLAWDSVACHRLSDESKFGTNGSSSSGGGI